MFGYEIDVNFVINKLRSFDTTNSWVSDVRKLKEKYGVSLKHDLKSGLKKLYTIKMGDDYVW